MECRVAAPLLALSALTLVFACTDAPHPDPGTELGAGIALPSARPVEGMLPAYQTATEREGLGKADALALRGSFESVYGVTDPPARGVRPLAEWEPVDAVLLAWQDGMEDFVISLVAELQAHTHVYVVTQDLDYSRALRSHFADLGLDTSRIGFFEYPHEAFWTRDFGPIPVELADGRPAFVDFSYFWDRQRDDAVPTLLGAYFDVPVYRPPLASEGGNFMTNGLGLCAVTTWKLEENPSHDARSLGSEMARYLGCSQTVVLQRLYGEGTGHIDMFAKFTREDTVLVGDYDADDDPVNARILDENAERLAQVRLPDGRRLRVIRIPMPAPYGDVYPSYTNSLLVNGVALVPVYRGSRHLEDDALAAYRQALAPGTEIVLVDSTDVIEWGGAVHCTTAGFRIDGGGFAVATPAPDVVPAVSTGAFEATPNSAIRDLSTIESVIRVPADGSRTGTLTLDLAIDHTYPGDLYITLSHDGVTGVIHDGGRSLPGPLTTDFFARTTRGGDWILTIEDRARGDEGRLIRWALGF